MSKKIERRDFLKAAAAGAGGALLASCQPAATPTPETITVIETVEVVKEGEVMTNKVVSQALQDHSDAYVSECSM